MGMYYMARAISHDVRLQLLVLFVFLLSFEREVHIARSSKDKIGNAQAMVMDSLCYGLRESSSTI